MPTDPKVAMRVHDLVINVASDVDLTNDAKLFLTLVIADYAKDKRGLTASEKLTRKRYWMDRVNELAGSASFCRMVIYDDVPRYVGENQDHGRGTCIADMIRREGPCGKKGYQYIRVIDPLTGRWSLEWYCTRHWSLDHEKRERELRQQWIDNDRPIPPANSGGMLRRHLNTNDWDAIYDWADPRRNTEGGKEPTIPRPKLSLIQGGSHVRDDETSDS